MKTNLLALVSLLFAFVAGLIFTPLARWLTRRLGIVDKPDGYRKIPTKTPIPLGGGYAILAAFLIPVIAVYLWDTDLASDLLSAHKPQLITLLLGAGIALGLGAADDVLSLRPRWKFLLQILAATFAYFGGFAITVISNPFGDTIILGVFSFPVTLLWFLGCMNAINLLDGLDGLAAGVGLFVCLTLSMVSFLGGRPSCLFLAASLSGAILAFLVYNFHPASIFLGDAGSMLIGFMIAALSLIGSHKAETAVALLIPFIALGLPIFDTGLAIIRRWARRLPIAAADRQHIHHVLLALGLSQRKVVLVLYLVCVSLGGIALLITAGRNKVAMIFLGILGIMAFVCVRVFGILDFGKLRDRVRADLDDRKRGSQASIEIEKAIYRMDTGETMEELWEVLYGSFERLELDNACLKLELAGTPRTFVWRSKKYAQVNHLPQPEISDQWSLFLKVYYADDVFGRLDVWKDSEEMPIRDACMLIDRLRVALGSNLRRLGSAKTTAAVQSPTGNPTPSQ